MKKGGAIIVKPTLSLDKGDAMERKTRGTDTHLLHQRGGKKEGKGAVYPDPLEGRIGSTSKKSWREGKTLKTKSRQGSTLQNKELSITGGQSWKERKKKQRKQEKENEKGLGKERKESWEDEAGRVTWGNGATLEETVLAYYH